MTKDQLIERLVQIGDLRDQAMQAKTALQCESVIGAAELLATVPLLVEIDAITADNEAAEESTSSFPARTATSST